ncbi:uncharacterized protein ARMOST_15603 [Armillaria ostoyae]|uniref:Uncharacterized protein n=1 Tax=Armillaria ostoyae TaxID=47428 RepID=A0A284RTS4_ARMOS|nr:uncharacterized protein ARMOST_15603 [Armillaria ostoyae]
MRLPILARYLIPLDVHRNRCFKVSHPASCMFVVFWNIDGSERNISQSTSDHPCQQRGGVSDPGNFFQKPQTCW